MRAVIVLASALALVGCRYTVVISSDGTEELGYCGNAAECIQKYCPGNEASPLKTVSASAISGGSTLPSDDIIRCINPRKGSNQ